MNNTVAVIAALDTKGEEAHFIAEVLRERGYRALLIDVGVMADSRSQVDVPASDVALAGDADLRTLRTAADKSAAMTAMTKGAAVIAAALYAKGRFDAVISIGGSAGTVIGTSAMRALPLGVPKIMVSTIAASDTRPYVGTKDVVMMHSVVDIAGLNRILTPILANAAGAVIGMLETRVPVREERPIIAASMFGNTTACVDRARALLTQAGYEVLVFHAVGSGGRTMEALISEGLIDGVLDLTTTEWADELCDGVFSAGPTRLDAAADAGVPQIVAPGCLDMANYFAPETVPARFANRKFFHWNPNITLMRTNVEENAQLGAIIARKVNRSIGAVSVLLPLLGVSQLDSPGGEFWWPQADQALFDAIRRDLRPEIPVIEMPANINDAAFAECAARTLLNSMPAVRPAT